MSKVKIIFALGVWVTILPYLGFPFSFKNVLFSVTGLGIIYLSYLLYNNSKTEETEKKTFDNFSENSNFSENKINSQEQIDLNKEKI
ncbi:MAG: hypothetical protein AAB913_02115 [Patescibacteria group bacterium]